MQTSKEHLQAARQASSASPASRALVLFVAVALILTLAGSRQAVTAQSEAAELSPNAERPLTHEELLAIRGERDRYETWGSATLVAETVIERDQPLRGGDEWSGEGPAFGALPRDDPHLGDPVVLASAEVAAQYPPDDSPISGLLAISDIHWEGLQLQGTVETPVGSYLTPIEPAAMATADALPLGALIVVHGSFSVQFASGSCPEVSARDPDDADDRYSPFMRCPGGWLTAPDVIESEPAGPAGVVEVDHLRGWPYTGRTGGELGSWPLTRSGSAVSVSSCERHRRIVRSSTGRWRRPGVISPISSSRT